MGGRRVGGGLSDSEGIDHDVRTPVLWPKHFNSEVHMDSATASHHPCECLPQYGRRHTLAPCCGPVLSGLLGWGPEVHRIKGERSLP